MSAFGRIAQWIRPRPQPRALPPTPPPVDRMDGWANAATGLGTERDRTTCNTFVGRMRRSDEELQAVYGYSALMARYIDLEPNTCMAKGFQVTELSGDDVTAFEAGMLRLNAFSQFADARRWARLYAGSLIFMSILDGQPNHEPVDEANVVTVKSLTVFTRREISVAKWCEILGDPNFGMPEIYRVTSFGKTFEIHHSRVLRFDGVNVDRYALRYGNYDGFGPSCVDQVWDAFEQYGTTHAYLNTGVSKVTQGVLKVKGLADAAKTSLVQKIQNRLKLLLRTMSVMGDIVVDADAGEDYSIVSRPMTGFSEASTLSEARLVGEMGVPKSLLMMQAPGGLANGENGGDWKYWAMNCGSKQQNVYESQVKKLVRLVFLSRYSPVVDPPQDFTITWPPILQMSEKEKAEIFALRAPGRASDVLAGVVAAPEARKADDVIEAYHLDSQDEVDPIEPNADPAGVQPPVPAELRIVGT